MCAMKSFQKFSRAWLCAVAYVAVFADSTAASCRIGVCAHVTRDEFARRGVVFEKCAEAGITVQGKGDYKLLTEPVEVDLIKKLGEYPEMLATAAKERAVQQVAHYVYDLAGLFHSAYNQCRILGVNEELQQARLAMVMAVGHVVRHALSILGVSAPEKM